VDALRGRGEVVPDGLPAHVAPLGWQHINLTDDYFWGADASRGPDGFRPLRGLPGTACHQNRRIGVFPLRAAMRAILPVLWRDPD
jgi:hypothetical protein